MSWQDWEWDPWQVLFIIVCYKIGSALGRIAWTLIEVRLGWT